jgi:hypothetical protein
MSLSNYITRIKTEDKFTYGAILVISVWFFNYAFRADISFLIALIIGFFIIYYKDDEVKFSADVMNNELEIKLNGLLLEEKRPPPMFFHIDPDMITFFDSIKDFRIYNRDSYVKAIKTTDNLLKLRRDLEYDYLYMQEREMDSWQNFELLHVPKQTKVVSNIKNHRDIFDSAEILANKGANYIHSFIINLPADKFYKNKHKEAMDRYRILATRNLDIILAHCQKYSNDILIGVDYGKAKPHTKLRENQSTLADSFNYF